MKEQSELCRLHSSNLMKILFLDCFDFTFRLSNYIVLDVSRCFSIVVKLHRRGSTSRGDGTQLCHVTKHLRQWNDSPDYLNTITCVKTLHLTTTTVQVTHDITHVFFWCQHLYLHDRLHQYWVTLRYGITVSHFSGQLKR